MKMESSTEDAEMAAADEFQDATATLPTFQTTEIDQRVLAMKQLKHKAIGSYRQKRLILQENLIPTFVAVLRGTDHEADGPFLTETVTLLGSLAKGPDSVLGALVDAEIISNLLKYISHSYRPLVEACLRCLRAIFANIDSKMIGDDFSKKIGFLDQDAATRLLSIANNSACNQECVAAILSRWCQTDVQRSLLLNAGAIEIMAPSLFSGVFKVRLGGLQFYAALCYRNLDAATCVASFVHMGRHLLDQFVALMSRENSLEMQVAAAKCLTNICRSEALESGHNIITLKVMPSLVGACRADPILGSSALRVEACETLAYLIEQNLDLQRLTHWNNQCLKILSTCINSTPSDLDDPKYADELQQGALCVVAALASNDEEIRKKVINEIQGVLDHTVRGLGADKPVKLQIASAKCLHALSRSVEQLRTTFLDRQLWRRLLALAKSDNHELSATASAVLCNLVLEFSPNKTVRREYFFEQLVEAGYIETMCELARREETSLRLNGIWGLMNLAFRADDKTKQCIVNALSPEQLLRLLTEVPAESPIVLRLLGLLRNLLSQKAPIDRLMASSGTSVMHAIIFVLEGDYAAVAKEQALCVLSNIAEGDSAKTFIMSNEDVLRKIANYMVHANARLQVAAISCICNLVWKSEPGSAERQSKLRELGVATRLQQLSNINDLDSALFDKVKTALEQMT